LSCCVRSVATKKHVLHKALLTESHVLHKNNT